MVQSVDDLLSQLDTPEPPVNYEDTEDEATQVGASWVNNPYNNIQLTRTLRFRSLIAWQLKMIHERPTNIEEKMLLFWHNHFPVEWGPVNEPRYLYRYWETLRTHALGNFRDLVKAITVDPAMLRYLDGRTNQKNKPNENYARELLELFSIGKGAQIAPGDYSNYTEDDILEIAKILTGWLDIGYNSNTVGEVSSEFVPNRHDTSDKQLSYHFANAIITNQGENEYIALVDIIFDQKETARTITRKLYRFLVSSEITEEIEENIIESLATTLFDNDYEIKYLVRELLLSSHFYEVLQIRGGLITNPVESIMSIYLSMPTSISEVDFTQQYKAWWRISRELNKMQMVYFSPPDVAGWTAYYLEPQYSELWLNSVTLKNRISAMKLALRKNGIVVGDHGYTIDLIAYINTLSIPADINTLIVDIAKHFYSHTLTEGQIDSLKEILIPGLEDFVWTLEYTEYMDNPTNNNLETQLRNKLEDLILQMVTIPEFQVI